MTDITLNLDSALQWASNPRRGAMSRTVGALSAALIILNGAEPTGQMLSKEALDLFEELVEQIQDKIDSLRASQAVEG